MKLIRQKGKHDCGIAATAMVLDLDYETVESWVQPSRRRDAKCGFIYYDLCDFMYRRNKVIQYIDKYDRLLPLTNTGQFALREVWPIDPFAPAHYLHIPGHWMVMDGHGTVFDPAGIYTEMPPNLVGIIGIFDRSEK
jgi:hypothetical protein